MQTKCNIKLGYVDRPAYRTCDEACPKSVQANQNLLHVITAYASHIKTNVGTLFNKL